MCSQDAEFPAVTICNLNQVELSYLHRIGIVNNSALLKLYMDAFLHGHNRTLNAEQQEEINDYLVSIDKEKALLGQNGKTGEFSQNTPDF